MTKRTKYYIVNALNDGTAEVLIYGDIYPYADCVRARDLMADLKNLEGTCTRINVRINCRGGDVYEGIAIFNAIRNCATPCDTYIDGIAASMGGVIAMAGKKVYMSKYARLMTHKPSGGAWGTADELRQVATEIDDVEAILTDILVDKTGMTKQAVADKYLNGTDVYLSADAAQKAGLIDGIYDGEPVEIPSGMTNDDDIENVYHSHFTARLTNNLTDNNQIIIIT